MRADVLQFLTSLKIYLYGDLDSFKKVCTEVELEELASVPPSGRGSMAGDTSSLSTTLTTTNPNPNIIMPSGSGMARPLATFDLATPTAQQPVKFRSTIPHALAVLSAMDILGFLTGTEANANGTEKNITLFLNPTITDPQAITCLVFIYRHGMSHSFFPKERIAIAAHSILAGKPLFVLDRDSVVTLNVNTLIEIMKAKFEAIMADMSIHPNIETQFDKLVTADQSKLTNKGFNLTTFAATLTSI